MEERTKPCTIRDVARYCKVGVSTVSRAINDDPEIAPATRERVLQAVRELHYVPNNSARNLKMTESRTVALLVRGIDNYFYQGMYDPIQRDLKKAGYDFIIHAVDETADVGQEASALIKEKRLCGMIILGGSIDKSARDLSSINVPFVLCTVAMPYGRSMPEFTTVGIDDEQASYSITEYLIKNGHSRIAFLGGRRSDRAVGAQRLEGYKKACRELGLPLEESLIFFMHDDIPEFSVENGYAMMRDVLASGVEFTAAYVISDLMAVGAYKALFEAGIRIPEDISVVGFDGINLGHFLHPTLTTVCQPRPQMADKAVSELIRMIQGDGHIEHNIFETELITGDSVSIKED